MDGKICCADYIVIERKGDDFMCLTCLINNKRYLYRLMGISSFIAAVLISFADFMLEFNSEYGVSFNSIIETSWVNMPHWRFSTSIYLCSFLIPFYILGFWLLYKLLSKTNERMALILFILFSYGIIMGSPLIHGLMSMNAIIYKFGIDNGFNHELLKLLIEGEITKTILPVFLIHYILTWLIASSILFTYILRGKTQLKRWTAFLNPLVFLIVGMIGLKVMPFLFVYLTPGAINKGNAALFLLLTIKMWNYREEELF